MKKFSPFIFGMVFLAQPFVLHAQLQLFTNAAPQGVFFGATKKVSITLHNSGGQNFKDEIRARIFQASSATAVLLSENPWKQVQVPAGETVLESAALDFPAVKAKTKFLVQWLADGSGAGFQPAQSGGTGRAGKMPAPLLGTTEVLVYPTNLLQALQAFLSETNFGVFDPGDRLKPLLEAQGIKFTDLAQTGLDDFSGQLAVIGPFPSRAQVPDGLAEQILSLAKTNVAVVWIQPWSARTRPRFESGDTSPQSKILPSFYCVQKNQTAVVVVQPELVDDLAENPQSQLNLIYFCQLAFNPQPPVLPGLSSP